MYRCHIIKSAKLKKLLKMEPILKSNCTVFFTPRYMFSKQKSTRLYFKERISLSQSKHNQLGVWEVYFRWVFRVLDTIWLQHYMTVYHYMVFLNNYKIVQIATLVVYMDLCSGIGIASDNWSAVPNKSIYLCFYDYI